MALFMCLGAITFGQQPKKTIASETLEAIKNDVWVPFMEAYDQLDSNKIKSIHSKDIVRVTIDQNNIETGNPYLDGFGGFIESMKTQGNKLGIAFAILSTATNATGDIAYQRGYYRLSSQGQGDETLQIRGYGYFNVGLRKEDGIWKIWLDSDSHTAISHDDFTNAEIVYELKN